MSGCHGVVPLVGMSCLPGLADLPIQDRICWRVVPRRCLKFLVPSLEDVHVVDDRLSEVVHVLRIRLGYIWTDVVRGVISCYAKCVAPIVEPLVDVALLLQLGQGLGKGPLVGSSLDRE